MRFRVLGPLEVTDPDGRPVDVGGAKPRALLTLLLADPGRVVGIDRIVSTLWGDDPPPTVTGTLQAYVSHLRRVLEPDRGPREAPTVLLTRPRGYLLRTDAAHLDLLRFSRLVEDGDRAVGAGDPARGIPLLDQALELWRGEPLAELGDLPNVTTDRLRLAELHVRARERRATRSWPSGGPTPPPATCSTWSANTRCASGSGPGWSPPCTPPTGRPTPSTRSAGAPSCCATNSASTLDRSCVTRAGCSDRGRHTRWRSPNRTSPASTASWPPARRRPFSVPPSPCRSRAREPPCSGESHVAARLRRLRRGSGPQRVVAMPPSTGRTAPVT